MAHGLGHCGPQALEHQLDGCAWALEHWLAGCAWALEHWLTGCGPQVSGTPACWLCTGSGTPACSLWPPGLWNTSWLVVHGLWNTNSLAVAPRALEHQLNRCGAWALLLHDEQSLPRPGFKLVHVFYIGRWTLYPWANREVPGLHFNRSNGKLQFYGKDYKDYSWKWSSEDLRMIYKKETSETPSQPEGR